MGAGPARRAAATVGRVFVGPWPLYPLAVVLMVFYSLALRGLVRIFSQPEGAAPYTDMVGPVVVMLAASTALGLIGTLLARRVLAAIDRRRGMPYGRLAYVVAMLGVSAAVTAAIIVTRVAYPDGAPPGQVPITGVSLLTAAVSVVALYSTNGLVGLALSRLKRQEAIIQDQLRVVREERSQLLVAEERVRAETARFLHDAMQSSLLRSSMRLAMIARESDDPAEQARLQEIVDEIDAVREDGVRGASRRLAPPLSSTGLIVALGELADAYQGTMAVSVELDDAARARFRMVGEDDRVALAVYRIAEQALQNALKHGRAGRVVIGIALDGDCVVLRVAADGHSPQPAARGGSGSAVINAWLDDVGGRWALTAGADGGSVLEARVRASS